MYVLLRTYGVLAALVTLGILARLATAVIVRVPADWPTIQQGLDALSATDTVLVDTGEYAEALIAPPIPFWLIGNVAIDTGDFARPIIDASLTPDSVHRGCLTLTDASAAAVERICFRNRFEMWPRGGIRTGGVFLDSDTASFVFCVFDSTYIAITKDQYEHPAASVYLEQCTFRDNRFGFVYLYTGHVHARECTFRGYGGSWYQLVCGESLIENCVFQNAGMASLTNWGEPNMTVRNCLFGPTDSSLYSYVELVNYRGQFENNTFSNLTMLSHALDVGADCQADVLVNGNSFYDCSRYSSAPPGIMNVLRIHCADDLSGQPFRVEDNVMTACSTDGPTVHSSGKGIYRRNRLYDLPRRNVPAIMIAMSDSTVLRENLLYNNGYGLQAGNGQEVDARMNWWGDSTGPYHPDLNPNGLGDWVSDGVLFDPWYPDSSFLSVPGIGKPLPESFVFKAYPNPFNSTVTFELVPNEVMIIKMELFDILGRRVREIWSGPLTFQKRITFEGSDLSSGIYFVRVSKPIGNQSLAMTKLVMMK